jgi:hypothetical protein
MPKGTIRRLATVQLAVLLALSVWLSWWASSLSLVKLPAADLWQHITLVQQASEGVVHLDTLLQKHNHLHFIPLPKLVYALDIALFAGSGLFTALVSAGFTLLCCLLFTRTIFDITSLDSSERIILSLLTSGWLVCILQWESFVNPANLQWSGMNAGLALIAIGLTKRPVWLFAGSVLSISCGAPWWLLLIALCLTQLPTRYLVGGIVSLAITVLAWEALNAYWLHRQLPLPLLAIQLSTPLAASDLDRLQTDFFNNPANFYQPWLQNFLAFLASFCVPPFERWLPPNLITGLALVPLMTFWLVCRHNRHENQNNGLAFITVALLLTALAAGMMRAHLPGAYTLRFANAGLLFISTSFVLGYLVCKQFRYGHLVWCTLAALYTALLMTTAWLEAQGIVHNSNQRRLSQAAYALDIHDARATSEMPFAPLMALSYREINERKGVLAARKIGIYDSLEHRVYSGGDLLPEQEIACDYADIQIKTLKDDLTARKVIGQTTTKDGDALPSILFLDSRKQAIGYGIQQIAGTTLVEQMTTPRRWAGFVKWPTDNLITIVAYDQRQHCRPFIFDSNTSTALP